MILLCCLCLAMSIADKMVKKGERIIITMVQLGYPCLLLQVCLAQVTLIYDEFLLHKVPEGLERTIITMRKKTEQAVNRKSHFGKWKHKLASRRNTVEIFRLKLKNLCAIFFEKICYCNMSLRNYEWIHCSV